MYLTIPQLLAGAAERDPGGIWLRSDDLPAGLTFEGAVTQVARTAGRLAQAGVRKGDLVVVTARSTPRYLLVWLALVSLGAISVPTNPESAPAELAGLLGQGRPRALVSDAGLAEVVAEAGAAALAELGVLDVGELTPAWDRPAASEA
ncbi:MAG TPA: AMP-binding protein, partial [Actinomycetes bacterium]